jgi:hypothetical protein
MPIAAAGTKPAYRYWLYLWGLLGLLAALALLLPMLDGEAIHALSSESGLVEILSALGYFVCVGALLVLGGWRFVLFRSPYVTFIVLFLGLRELDFDKRLTTVGIFKSEFYLSDAISWTEKGLVILFFALLIWCLIESVERNWRRFLSLMRDRHPFPACIILAVLFGVVAKSLDGLARKVDGLGWTTSERGYLVVQGVEEILELGIPLMLILAVLIYFRVSGTRKASDDRP